MLVVNFQTFEVHKSFGKYVKNNWFSNKSKKIWVFRNLELVNLKYNDVVKIYLYITLSTKYLKLRNLMGFIFSCISFLFLARYTSQFLFLLHFFKMSFSCLSYRFQVQIVIWRFIDLCILFWNYFGNPSINLYLSADAT